MALELMKTEEQGGRIGSDSNRSRGWVAGCRRELDRVEEEEDLGMHLGLSLLENWRFLHAFS